MSRAGGVAARETRTQTELKSLVSQSGLSEAARATYAAREAELVEVSKRTIVGLCRSILALEIVEPFVLDDFAFWLEEHERVCVRAEDILFWYRPREGSLSVITGRCLECGQIPFSSSIGSLVDLGKALSPRRQEHALTFHCSLCRETTKT